MGSDHSTPSTPRKSGRMKIRGSTSATFRNSEKKMANFALPNPVKVAYPDIWKAMKQKPKK